MDLRSYGMYKNSQVEEASRLFYFVGDEIRYVTNDKVAGYDPNDPTIFFAGLRELAKTLPFRFFTELFSVCKRRCQ